MQEKLNQLSLGEKLVVGGAVVVFLASFFNWAKYDVGVEGFGSSSGGDSGWGSPGSMWGILAILISIALAGLIVAIKFGNVKAPALPTNVTWGMVYAAGAALVILFMLLKAWRIMALPDCGGAGDLEGFTCDIGFGIGYFIALIGAIALAAGGFMLYNEDKGVGFGGLRSNT